MAQTKYRTNESNVQTSGDDMTDSHDNDDMVKSERMDLLLEFMAEHPLAMPPIVIYRNLRIHRNLRVRKETVKNYLQELAEDGLVRRVDKGSLDDGKVVDADEDGRAYYIITEKGRRELNDEG
jgi:predicted transcriptional regulator